jgi:hypothetical protein
MKFMFNASLLMLIASLLFAGYTIVKFNLTLNDMLFQSGLVEKRVECVTKLAGARPVRNSKGELCK